jgi:FixJ family two-component response regulator
LSNQSPVVHLVDDDPSVLKAFSRLLATEGYETRSFASPRSFLDQHDPNLPGCIILDVALPELSGLDLQRLITTSKLSQPVIFVSGRSDIPISVAAMKNGAFDFLTKPVDADSLLNAVREAVRKDAEARTSSAELGQLEERVLRLSPRERAVFAQVTMGRLNKQIAVALGIVEKTVKVHRASMMKKIGVRTVAELVHIADRLGIDCEALFGPVPATMPRGTKVAGPLPIGSQPEEGTLSQG